MRLKNCKGVFGALLVAASFLLNGIGLSLVCTDETLRPQLVIQDAATSQELCRAEQGGSNGWAVENLSFFEIPYNPASFTIQYYTARSSADPE